MITKIHKNRTSFYLLTVVISFLLVSLASNFFHLESHSTSAATGGLINGVVFQDSNENGKRNAGDVGLQGWNVTLTGKSGSSIIGPITATTNSLGVYSFPNLGDGKYTLTETIRSGWGPTSNPIIANIQIINGSFATQNIFGVQDLFNTIHNSDYSRISPELLVFGPKGILYDPQNLEGNIKKFDANGNLKLIIGSKGKLPGQFSRPSGITIDKFGYLWVADENDKISKFSNNGTFIMSFGGFGNDTKSFNWPRGLTVDSKNNLYITDGFNNRVMKFDNKGNYLMTIGKGAGWYNGYFLIPYDVKLDSHENIYVVDTGNDRIQEFDPKGNFIASFGESGKDPGNFNRPRAIFFGQNDEIYVADAYNSRIQIFDSNFNFIRSFGTFGSGLGQFANPSGVTVDGNGTIYVADASNARIEKFDSMGNFQSQFLSRASPIQPYFVTFDSSGNLLVTDGINHVVLIFDSKTGAYLSKFGGVGTDPGQFHGPRGIKTDSNGNIIVADNYNNRVQKFDKNGKFLSSFGSTGNGSGQFNQVRGIVIDKSGNILAADSQNGRIQKFSSNGAFLSSLKVPLPYGIAVDNNGDIYDAEFLADYVEKFHPTGNSVLKIGGFGKNPGQLWSPRDMVIDSSGKIYVTDSYNNRVQIFSKTGTLLKSFASFGSGPNQLNTPRGIALDSSGNIWVADAANGRVSEFDNNGNPIKQVPFSVTGINVTGTLKRIPHLTGWYNQPVQITWSGSEIGTGILSCDPPIIYSGPSAKGTVIEGHCKDKEGITGSGGVQINYDDIPPILNLPNNIVVNTINSSGTTVQYLVNASDNLSGPRVPICSPLSGSNFPIGNTTVTCTDLDLAGNLATGQFVIKVQKILPKPTVLNMIIGPLSLPWGQSITLSGKLTNSSGFGIGGMTINIKGTAMGGNILHVTTNQDGSFNDTISAPFTVSNAWTIQAEFAGSSTYAQSNSSESTFKTTKHGTIISLQIQPSSVTAGSQYKVYGLLLDANNNTQFNTPINSKTITFTSTSPIAIPNAITNSTGYYSVLGLIAPNNSGAYNITAKFVGDSLYLPRQTLSKTLTVK